MMKTVHIYIYIYMCTHTHIYPTSGALEPVSAVSVATQRKDKSFNFPLLKKKKKEKDFESFNILQCGMTEF